MSRGWDQFQVNQYQARRKSPAHREAESAEVEFERERDLQDQVARFLRIECGWFLQQPFGKKTTAPAGTPDFIFAWRGIPCAVECKAGDNTLTDEQKITLVAMQEGSGWKCYVCRDLVGLKNWLRKIESVNDVPTP